MKECTYSPGVFQSTMEIHKKQLTLFGNVIRYDCVERELAIRQLSTKDNSSNSWFIVTYVNCLISTTCPVCLILVNKRLTKLQWKTTITSKVVDFWTKKGYIGWYVSKALITFLNKDNLKYSKVHRLWSSTGTEPTAVTRSCLKAKLLVGVYTLQVNRCKFNQHNISRTCPLCHADDEDTVHFLIQCQALHTVRSPFMTKLQDILKQYNCMIPTSEREAQTFLCQVILTSSISTILTARLHKKSRV